MGHIHTLLHRNYTEIEAAKQVHRSVYVSMQNPDDVFFLFKYALLTVWERRERKIQEKQNREREDDDSTTSGERT